MQGRKITPPRSSPLSSVTGTPESCCSSDDIAAGDFPPRTATVAGGNLNDWFEIEKNEAVRELQEWVNRYNQCFRLLKDAVTAVELLREENLQLEAENLELEFLIKEMERVEREVTGLEIGSSPAGTQLASVGEKLGKSISGGGGRRSGSDLDSPGGSGSGSGFASGAESGSGSGFASGVESGSGSGSGSGSDRSRGAGVPKSISIRSRGFLALNLPQAGEAHRLRLPLSPALHVSFGWRHVGHHRFKNLHTPPLRIVPLIS